AMGGTLQHRAAGCMRLALERTALPALVTDHRLVAAIALVHTIAMVAEQYQRRLAAGIALVEPVLCLLAQCVAGRRAVVGPRGQGRVAAELVLLLARQVGPAVAVAARRVVRIDHGGRVGLIVQGWSGIAVGCQNALGVTLPACILAQCLLHPIVVAVEAVAV